jgi:hypothetical protein
MTQIRSVVQVSLIPVIVSGFRCAYAGCMEFEDYHRPHRDWSLPYTSCSN